MMRGALLFLAGSISTLAVTPTRPVCVGAVQAGRFRLDVIRGSSAARPLSRMNVVQQGDRIRYEPLELPADIKNSARIAVAVAPATAPDGPPPALSVLEFKPAAASGEWVAPFRIGLVVLAFGPQGLDEKKMNSLIGKDEGLVAGLADYAERTADLESTLDSLHAIEDDEDAAVQDPTPIIERPTATEQAMLAFLRSVNPAASAYNPLTGGRRMGPVTMMSKASTGFFDNAGSLFFGGGALSELRPLLFPDTEFRASYLQSMGTNGQTLCAQRIVPGSAKNRNRIVYLWSRRIPDAPAPAYALAGNPRLPLGTRSLVGVRLAQGSDWRLVDSVEDWSLAAAGAAAAALPAKVRPTPQGRYLEIDLHQFKGAPGSYRLEGKWDWDKVVVNGQLELAPLSDLRIARVDPASQTRMVEGGGLTTISLTGANFEFVDRVTLRRADNRTGKGEDVDFALPKGRRQGPQDRIDVDLDLNRLRAGSYLLAFAQADARPQETTVQVAPAAARFELRPLRINAGEAQQQVVLRGVGVDQIERIEAAGIEVQLEPKTRDASQRPAIIKLRNDLKKGARVDLQVKLEGIDSPHRVSEALEISGPRPKILAANAVLPANGGVALQKGELPAGAYVNIRFQLENVDGPAALSLGCAGDPQPPLRLRAGEKDRGASLFSSTPQDLFLSFDPGSAAAGCTLTAIASTDASGASDPFTLGKVVRLPKIESFVLTDEKQADGSYAAVLKGFDLETIEKTGWDAAAGQPAVDAPAPLSGEGQKQSLRIFVPWPSPAPRGPLYIWLRGEQDGRATTAKY